jgi:hypothetical protein
MLAALLVSLSILGSCWYFSVSIPFQLNMMQLAVADTAAANFWSYERALSAYQAAHPAVSGVIQDSSLTFEQGFIRTADWTNYVQSGVLYTYSKNALAPGVMEAIANRGGRSLMIGRAQANQTMTSLTGGASGFPLPATIPAGSLVVIGG